MNRSECEEDRQDGDRFGSVSSSTVAEAVIQDVVIMVGRRGSLHMILLQQSSRTATIW